MTSISVSIMAHPSRDRMAEALADELSAQGLPSPAVICYDTDGEGEILTADRAWAGSLLVADWGADWHVVLQDDAVLQPWSLEQMSAALEARSTDRALVSFYVGTGRPRQQAVQAAFQRADSQGAAWLRCDAMLWGVAVAMPTAVVPGYLRWSGHAGRRDAYDRRLGSFARQHAMPVFYTWPSLVDHADGPSLVKHPWGEPRSPRIAYRLGRRDDWDTHAVRMA